MTTINTGDKHQRKLAAQKKYREGNREKIRAQAREYDTKFRQTEHRKKYLEDNKEKHSEWKKDWYQRNRENVLARVKKRASETTERRKEYIKEYRQRPESMALKCEQAARYRKGKKVQIAARRVAYNALRRNEIQKKHCEKCGKEKVEMHHADYSEPLKIVWLCKRCHMIADGIMPLS